MLQLFKERNRFCIQFHSQNLPHNSVIAEKEPIVGINTVWSHSKGTPNRKLFSPVRNFCYLGRSINYHITKLQTFKLKGALPINNTTPPGFLLPGEAGPQL